MEKLLHERLREHNKTTSKYFTCGDEWQIELDMNEAQALAAEIERYYIQRPRFEDGEPVQFGDDIEIYDRSGLLDKGIIQSFHPNSGTVWMLSLVGCDHERLVSYDHDTCAIKRPTPKVYDADGVAYEFGETVFDVETGEEVTIEALDECGVKVSCSNIWWSNDCFTHERPVFDAEGVRICKLETVWLESQPHAYTVTGFNGKWVVARGIDGREHQFPHPDILTHREPDSSEKIREDARKLVQSLADKYEDGDTLWTDSYCPLTVLEAIEQLLDRESALVERGA